MKAKQLKDGSWTISGVATTELEALSKVLEFARCAEGAYGNHIEEERRAIDKLRKDEDTLSMAFTWGSFIKFLISE